MGNNELLAVIEHMEKERGIERETLIQMVEAALLSAARKILGNTRDLRIHLDRKTFDIKAFAKAEVVEGGRASAGKIILAEARKTNPSAKPGDLIEVELSAKELGRIAAQTAKQTIIQKIRQAEKEIVVKEYKDKLNDIITGTVLRVEKGDVIVDLGKVEAIMPAKECVPTEEFQPGDKIRAYVTSVTDQGSGYHIVLSRSNINFVRRLFELEISEIADKTIEIKAIAREPGYRTKIAVASKDEKVDPVGACVGMRGMRVKNIVKELYGEKIDIIKWSSDLKTYVTNALNPAKINKLIIDEGARKVIIFVDADQLSLAIGKKGQNARLTSKLIGWKIDIQKDKEDISVAEKMEKAIQSLMRIDGVDRTLAEKLLKGGFNSIEGIIEADVQDLVEATELDQASAARIKQSAEKLTEQVDNSTTTTTS